MAIAYQASVDSFGGTAFYLERGSRGLADPAERVEWIETRNLGGIEETQLAATYMDATAAQNPHIEKGGYHFSISFHPEDRPQLDQEQMSRIADQVLEKLGLEEHQALIVAHKDTEHPHFHVLVNRVHPEDLKAWDRWQDRPRMQESLRHLELEHGLRQTPGYLYQLPGQEPPNPELSQTIAEARRGREAFADVLRGRDVAEDLKAAMSWEDLETRLEREGLYLKKAGRGLQLTDGERTAKPSRLHRKSSLANLEERFGEKYATYRAREPQKIPVAAERASPGRDDVPAGGKIDQERGARAARGRDLDAGLDRLREAIGKVGRWDQLVAESREVSAARYKLTYRGSIPDLERIIGGSDGQAEAAAAARLRSIFRDPEGARAALARSYGDVGRDATYKRLAEQPQEFGKLRGQSIFGAVTDARERALKVAYDSGRAALERGQHQQKLRGELEQAEGYRLQQLAFRREQGELGNRDELVAGVGRRAKGLKLGQLKRHLTPEQYKLLEGIRRDEREHLQPLREAIRKLDRARAQGARGLRLAKKVAGLYGLAPRHIVMRLLPQQVQTAVAAVKLVRSLARSMNRGLSR